MAARSKSSQRSKSESPNANELLVLELQEIYSAESQLSRALPRLSRSVDSDKLRKMLDERQEEGTRILEELDGAFEGMDRSPGRKKNIAAEGLINDIREHVQEIAQGPGLDAVIIAAMQKTEHYCIAAWGTAKSLAQAVGNKTASRAMDRAIKEGKGVDEQLTQLAEKEITPALLEVGDAEDTETAARARKGSSSGSGATTT
jgi:ferritin-like metal-binding protein YciE